MEESSEPARDLWTALRWEPSPEQLQDLIKLQELLRHWNRQLNLTRLVEGEDYWINQVFDSLWPLTEELKSSTSSRECIDVGTGGGFPGLAMAIALPGTRMTLVDSVGRKTAAVQAMASALGLSKRIRIRTERIESTGRDRTCRGRFDLAVARAVASAPVVAEYLVPLLRDSGEALLYRGQWSDADSTDLSKALKPLKATIHDVQTLQLPAGRGVRHVLRVRSVSRCPDTYPRPIGVPGKVPLGTAQ